MYGVRFILTIVNMEKVFTIPQEEVKGIVRSVLNQKIMSVVLGLLVCSVFFFDNKSNSGISLIKGFALERLLIGYSFLILLCTGLLVFARRGFTRLYESFQITINEQGIERYCVLMIHRDRFGEYDNVYFAWEDVSTRYKESSRWLTVYSGTHKIVIPKQIEHYEELKAIIADRTSHA